MNQPASRLPQTVALIPDGNARWAAERGLTTREGHMAGAAVAIERARDACQLGIEQLTIFVFSTENWTRPAAEVSALMNLFAASFDHVVNALAPYGVRIRLVGARGGLPDALLQAADRAEDATAHNSRMSLFFGLNYGGRQELLAAAQRYNGGGEEVFRQFLYAPDMRDLDLVIRTGRQRRMSNSFLWQSSYSELLFVDELWPDFTRERFELGLADFGKRVRSMGGHATPVEARIQARAERQVRDPVTTA